MESKQRDIVRDLARKVAEIAASPENEQRQKRWRDVNGLRKPDRAPVWCNPIGAWSEMLPDESLLCEDRRLRSIERGFRQMLVKHEMDDDSIVEPHFPVPAAFDCDPPNKWGVDVNKRESGQPGGAWGYDPPLKTAADYDRLRLPSFTYNEARTSEALSKADDLLGDILPVKLVCGLPLSTILGTYAADLRGLSEMMMDMIAEPELMHRLMTHLRDGLLQTMNQIEATGLLTPNNNAPMFCSDPIGVPSPDGRITLKNLWGGANGQEFDAVSPTMWEEFCLSYQKPLLERCGLSAYGCCENLTHKIDGVLTIPNLRIFVSSAWTDLDKVIERVGDRHTIMWRQKASEVVFACDLDDLKDALEDGMRRLKGCYYQIVLRELQTVAGRMDRLHKWTRLVVETAEKYA